MSVIIGSARIDENGKTSGGKAGDQTGKECSKQNFYVHSKGWYVLRARDKSISKKLAWCMNEICNNNNIGYDQSNRLSLYNISKKYNFDVAMVNTPCETDCSASVRVCLAYAGIETKNFTTADEKNTIMATGKFDCYLYKTGFQLIAGDILVTKIKGHTAIVVSSDNTLPVLKKGSKGDYVGILQTKLNKLGFDCGIVDKEFGIRTETSVIAFQGMRGLKKDGVVGNATWKELGVSV